MILKHNPITMANPPYKCTVPNGIVHRNTKKVHINAYAPFFSKNK